MQEIEYLEPNKRKKEEPPEMQNVHSGGIFSYKN